MNFLLVASSPLQPFVERLLPQSPHEIGTVFLPEATPAAARALLSRLPEGCDALLLADGAALLDGEGLSAGMRLVLPRVHNAASLLLGAARYRRLFAQQEGGVCWRLPGWERELFFSPAADCNCLCYLGDTQLGLPDDALAARASAREHGWDFLCREADPALLSALLAGDWDERFTVAAPGERALLTYDARLLDAGA